MHGPRQTRRLPECAIDDADAYLLAALQSGHTSRQAPRASQPGQATSPVYIGELPLASAPQAATTVTVDLAATRMLHHNQPMFMQHSESMQAALRGASRGATSATSSRQTRADAIAIALERWETAILRSKHIVNVERWAFRVAANAARRLTKRHEIPVGTMPQERDSREGPRTPSASESVHGSPPPTKMPSRHELLTVLHRLGKFLRGRQLEVALKLAERGMTLHRAAKELAMHRCNVRRAFRSALRKLASLGKVIPPPL